MRNAFEGLIQNNIAHHQLMSLVNEERDNPFEQPEQKHPHTIPVTQQIDPHLK